MILGVDLTVVLLHPGDVPHGIHAIVEEGSDHLLEVPLLLLILAYARRMLMVIVFH